MKKKSKLRINLLFIEQIFWWYTCLGINVYLINNTIMTMTDMVQNQTKESLVD